MDFNSCYADAASPNSNMLLIMSNIIYLHSLLSLPCALVANFIASFKIVTAIWYYLMLEREWAMRQYVGTSKLC